MTKLSTAGFAAAHLFRFSDVCFVTYYVTKRWSLAFSKTEVRSRGEGFSEELSSAEE
jgi:hypothetical protein